MAENPLIAKPEESASAAGGLLTNMGSTEGPQLGLADGGLNNATQGAGIFSDAANTITDFANGDWGWGLFDLAVVGLDLLAAVMNPMATLISAGVGWAMEHISFLKEPLDVLCGDPVAVTAHSTTWHNIAQELEAAATAYDKSAKNVGQTWKNCDSADLYQKGAHNYGSVLHNASKHAENASTAIKYAGMAVGVERGLIRDNIADFIGDVLGDLLEAAGLAIPTCGASIVAAISALVVQAVDMAARSAQKIAQLLKNLGKMAEGAEKSAKAMRQTAEQMTNVAKRADQVAATTKNTGRAERATQIAAHATNKAEAAASKAKAAERRVAAGKKVDEWGNSLDNWGKTKEAEGAARQAKHAETVQQAKALDSANRNVRRAETQEKLAKLGGDPDKVAQAERNTEAAKRAYEDAVAAGKGSDSAVGRAQAHAAHVHDRIEETPGLDEGTESAKSYHEGEDASEKSQEAYDKEHAGESGEPEKPAGIMNPEVPDEYGRQPVGNSGHVSGRIY